MNITQTQTKMQTKVQERAKPTQTLLNQVLKEIRILRHEFSLLLPAEDLEEYEHADRIKRSYQKAMKKYPPAV